jgi:hypothetical protein
VLVGLVISIFLARTWRGPQIDTDEQGLPTELRGAPLIHAEQTFRSLQHRLVARLDRAYAIGGEVVLVEFKTRQGNVVHLTDIIELSVQRLALQDDRGVVVSMQAWVVIEDRSSGIRSSRRVTLLDQQEVARLRQRYLDVQEGRAADVGTAKSCGQCRSCGHRDTCEFSKASSESLRSVARR